MKPVATSVGVLRERLLAPELAEARACNAEAGFAALVEHALAALGASERSREAFAMVSREIDAASPSERARVVERHLRATVTEPKRLARDLRALRSGDPAWFDYGALLERALRQTEGHERRAEAALAVARSVASASSHTSPAEAITALCELAQTPGRPSRRIEALRVLARLARGSLPAALRRQVAHCAHELAAPSEPRFVQPAALALLMVADPAVAHDLAAERLRSDLGGEDFIVRASFVRQLGLLRSPAAQELVALAHADSSELVRMTAVRARRDVSVLVAIAASDGSPKVRATALIALRKRDAAAFTSAARRALDGDPHGLVVEVAARHLAVLAKQHALEASTEVLPALARAAERVDLTASARAACEEGLVACDVLCDTGLRAAFDALDGVLQVLPLGGRRVLEARAAADLDQRRLARVLTLLATGDFGVGIDRKGSGLLVHRGERRRLAWWRVLHELRHPSASKRQGFDHHTGKHPAGALRSPPSGMAELATTRVPGERVLGSDGVSWGRHLPLVDDLLSTGVVAPRTIAIASPRGVATLVPARTLWARLSGRLRLTRDYARFDDLRQRALHALEPEARGAYVREVGRRANIAITFAPYTVDGEGSLALEPPAEFANVVDRGAKTRALLLLVPLVPFVNGLASLRDTWQELLFYATTPAGNRLSHLAVYSFTLLSGLVLRNLAIAEGIERDRAALPLVMGGWGTRGKSGTERLKAALLQGLGHEVLVKTTGCEAMFIHALPGIPASEVFIYRPYDKATVWEQREILSLARRLGTRALLWECMALQPDLVSLLQSQWMRDDFSTVTNAYPDHEEVQGPTGFDVANVIAEFVPRRGRLVTTEEQMLPVLRARARERGTRLTAVPSIDAELVPEELLARFPYQEHPKNVALVVALARHLGVDPIQAMVEMADHVVPDLGVLKTYPSVVVRGRELSFTNGMSANERTGALANWRRAGFEQHDPERDPDRFIVTVVNNRADRVARSEVFARVIVQDLAAHRHVLIGTNVSGLLAFVRGALADHVRSLGLTRDLGDDPAERMAALHARIDRAFAQLKVSACECASVRREWEALGLPELEPEAVEALLEPSAAGEPYALSLERVSGALAPRVDAERLPFAARSLATRRAVRALHDLAERAPASDAAAIEAAFAATYGALFEDTLVPCLDSTLGGDAIIDIIAQAAPPGSRVSIMGIQNIKGTGLDFVYRWVSIDFVERALSELGAPERARRERALSRLLLHDDYGSLDARRALDAVLAARSQDPEAGSLACDAVVAKLRAVVARKSAAAQVGHSNRLQVRLRALVGETVDFLDAVYRRRQARRVQRALVDGHMSHAAAALRMREIMARTKGAFMRKRTEC